MKLYQATYSDCIYESGFSTISIHRTKEGAEKALKSHRRKEVRKLRKNYLEMLELDPTGNYEQGKIQKWQQWLVIPIELKD